MSAQSTDLIGMAEKRLREGLHRLIPEHMHDGVIRYVIDGVPPGSFLHAVLSNDLKEAFARADHINQHAMRNWAEFLITSVPASCQGSATNVAAWIKDGGLIGSLFGNPNSTEREDESANSD